MQGELTERDGRWEVRFTRVLPHPPEKVWRALTDPEHLAAWFPTTIEGERAAGAPLRFAFRGGEGAPFEGEMIRYEPPRLLEFRWGEDELRFEIRPEGAGCVLTLVDRLAELGKASRDAAGWHICIMRLDRHLSGEAPADLPWKPVHAAYVEAFGEAASEIGPPEPAG